MGFGLESDDKYNETKNSFTNVEDLARIAETVEILDFAEKAIQAVLANHGNAQMALYNSVANAESTADMTLAWRRGGP